MKLLIACFFLAHLSLAKQILGIISSDRILDQARSLKDDVKENLSQMFLIKEVIGTDQFEVFDQISNWNESENGVIGVIDITNSQFFNLLIGKACEDFQILHIFISYEELNKALLPFSINLIPSTQDLEVATYYMLKQLG